MFIETMDTPNPNSLKFMPGQDLLGQGQMGMDFPTPEAAHAVPLARALFDIDGVLSVFLGPDFLTISKDQTVDWLHIKPAILGTIADYLAAGLPITAPAASQGGALATPATGSAPGSADEYQGESREIVEQILDLLDTRVRPAVASDGGDIIFHKYIEAEGIVLLTMRGACAGCPSATLTLKSGIENLLRHYIPEIVAVEAVA